MNYGPYMGFPYYSNVASTGGLFSKLFSNISLSSIINNTQKTLNIVNQAIPVIKQVKPVIGNAKTMFKVLNEFKRNDTTTTNKNIISNTNNNSPKESIKYSSGPTFFI